MIDMEKLNKETDKWMNRVTKWRTVFTGWQLGTRPKGDPESDAIRDQREILICLRVEVSAILGILLKKGVITQEEWQLQLIEECKALDAAFERRFPGFKSTDDGISIDPKVAINTTKGWKP